jgi:hypothetical protein
MLNKIITVLRQPAMEYDATGTFADGAFHMALALQTAFDRNYGLRNSYQQDTMAAAKREQGLPLSS